MACDDKVKLTCGEVFPATCVDFEGDLGANTKITDDCVTIEETTEDLYEITDEIISDLDTSELGTLCITYPLEDGLIKPKNVFKQLEEEICNLQTQLGTATDLENLDITGWSIDLECLSDACNDPITTLGGLLQALVTKVCETP